MRHLANEPPRDHADAYFLARTGQILRIGYGFGLILLRTMGTLPRSFLLGRL